MIKNGVHLELKNLQIFSLLLVSPVLLWQKSGSLCIFSLYGKLDSFCRTSCYLFNKPIPLHDDQALFLTHIHDAGTPGFNAIANQRPIYWVRSRFL